MGQEKLILGHHEMNYGTKQGQFLGYWRIILVYLGRWSYGRFQDNNNIFYRMKNDLTTGTHQKQHHVPYSLAILINGTFLLIHGSASTLWAFQYVFLIIYFPYFLFLVIFSCLSETVPYLRNYYFQKFGLPSILILCIFI